MTNKDKILTVYKKQLVTFLSQLTCSDSPSKDIVEARLKLESIPSSRLMLSFIENTDESDEEKCKDRNLSLFNTKKNMFGDSSAVINGFILRAFGNAEKSDVEHVWKFMEVFFKCKSSYTKAHRVERIGDKFKKQIMQFLAQLKEIIPVDKHPTELSVNIMLLNAAEGTVLLKKFFQQISKDRLELVTNRDDSFLSKHEIFGDVNVKIIETVDETWRGLSPVEQNVIWRYLDIFAKCAVLYGKTMDKQIPDKYTELVPEEEKIVYFDKVPTKTRGRKAK